MKQGSWEQRVGLSRQSGPASTRRHWQNKAAFPRQRPNNGLHSGGANKAREAREDRKAPATPVRTNLQASRIPPRTFTPALHKLLCCITAQGRGSKEHFSTQINDVFLLLSAAEIVIWDFYKNVLRNRIYILIR